MRQEFEALKSLHCNVIAGVVELFQDVNNFYMVGEAFYGGDFLTLKERARNQLGEAALNEDWWRDVFRQCFSALAFMHQQAVIHCDIKEPNIMFKSKEYHNPVVALIDFGMAKWSSSDGLAGGTPGYRPPETNDTNVWFPRGDVFSMGVTFFQLLADKVPDEKTLKPGIFTEGAQSLEQVNYFVRTRQPPYYLIQSKYPGVMSWLPKMLDKQLLNRPKAPQVLDEPWFKGVGAAADAVMPATELIQPMPFDDEVP